MRDDSDLRQRLAAFAFDDPGAAFPFSARLARDNGWNRDFALRAIEEYRRFLYLACVAPREVTPSQAVDAVWHLHLAYTRSYWDDLCGQVLRRPLHHSPTSGGPAENRRFRAAYAATLRWYEQAFGAPPPADVWPDVATRFAPRPSIRRKVWRPAWVALAVGLTASGAALAADGAGFPKAVAVVTVAGVGAFIVWLIRRGANAQNRKGDSSGCGGIGGVDSSSHASGDSGSGDSGSGCSGGGGCGGGGD